MIIQCEACKTKFRVGDDKVKPPGIKVRCSKCGEVFFFEYSLHEDPVDPVIEEPVVQDEAPSPSPFAEEPEQVAQQDSPLPETEPETQQAEAVNSEDNEPSEPPGDISFETPPDTSEFDSNEFQIKSNDEGLETDKPEISGLDINTDKSADDFEETSESSFFNLEIDHLDDMAEEQGVTKSDDQPDEFKSPLDPEPENDQENLPQERPQQEKPQNEFQAPSLSLDQEVLEQTYTKGTVASSSEVQQPSYSSEKKSRTVRRYPKGRKSGGGFFRKFFMWVFSLILIAALSLLSMFLLNETKIYPNDYFARFNSVAGKYYGGFSKEDLKKSIRIKGDTGSWVSSKYGQVYVVSGEVVNTLNTPVNYLKLRVYYISDGTNIFIQELFAGNTLSKREIKNSSFNTLQAKLNRKNGDISYDDADNLDGLNFDIQPGEVIPFYSVFPAKEKILGLKYRVEVVEYDSAEITQNP